MIEGRKIRPCPFCGGEGKTDILIKPTYVSFYIICSKCGTKTPGGGYCVNNRDSWVEVEIAMDKAIEGWNKRF